MQSRILLGILFATAIAGCGAIYPALTAGGSAGLRARAAGVSLDLLTYNTWGLPAPIGTKLKERFGKISALIGGHDVVALQETFSGESRQIFDAKVYPYGYRQSHAGFPKLLPSGLALFSKCPLENIGFRAFEKCGTWDCHARKGVLHATVQVPGVGPIELYTTHYQADAEFVRERLDDNRILVDFVKENDKGNPTFLLGDFNFWEDEDEYGDLQDRLPSWDLFRKFAPNAPGNTADPIGNPWIKGDGEAERIDYIFYVPSSKVDLEIDKAAVVLSDDPQSDHYGVHAKVRLTPKL